ncbi:MAG: AMIN domain-containing protein [Acidobacteria bacterium]|nr:AMIN domain-containing protein [Acidobacteriota bacterium]
MLSVRHLALGRCLASLAIIAASVGLPSPALGQRAAGQAPGRQADAIADVGVAGSVNWIESIERELLPGTDRITVTLGPGGDLVHHAGQLTAPPRLYFDLASVDVEPIVSAASFSYTDGVVRSIRVGRHPRRTTRVVLDLDHMASYTVTTAQDPVRFVVDVARPMPAATAAPVNTAAVSAPAVSAVSQAAQTGAAREFVELQALGGPNAFCPA